MERPCSIGTALNSVGEVTIRSIELFSSNSAYGDWNAFSVVSPTASSGDNAPEPPAGLPMEVVYAAIAVIVIVVVVLGVYIFP